MTTQYGIVVPSEADKKDTRDFLSPPPYQDASISATTPLKQEMTTNAKPLDRTFHLCPMPDGDCWCCTDSMFGWYCFKVKHVDEDCRDATCACMLCPIPCCINVKNCVCKC